MDKESYYQGGQHPKRTVTLDDHPSIQGFDPSAMTDISEFIRALGGIGYQASHVAQALETIKAMRREGATIFFSYTSNMVTSGNRELICYLVKHKMVDVIVTTAGGIEEDVMKCYAPFKLGKFDVPGKPLFEEAIHRSGNIFIPTDRYTHLEKFVSPFLDEIFAEKKHWHVHEIISRMGKNLNHDESILTWAYRNEIPIFCPGLQDGAFGEFFYFQRHHDKEFIVDISEENARITELALLADSAGLISLGGGISKHFAMLANILREGLNYMVLINTGEEFDGSDSGARPEEAITWVKLRHDAMHVKVHCDATIVFPLIASAWVQWELSRNQNP